MATLMIILLIQISKPSLTKRSLHNIERRLRKGKPKIRTHSGFKRKRRSVAKWNRHDVTNKPEDILNNMAAKDVLTENTSSDMEDSIEVEKRLNESDAVINK